MSPLRGPTDPRPRVGPVRIGLFALMFFGLAVTEEVSNNVLPLTLKRITEGFQLEFTLPFSVPGIAPGGHFTMASAFIIGLVLALNPLFGFIAQPLVGIWSDRVWTRVGRRATFIVLAAPTVATCLFAIPFAEALWQLVIIVLVYQFFQDILWGSDHPLLADLFPSRQRGLVAAATAAAYQLGAVFVTRFGLTWIDTHERTHGGRLFGAPIYWWAAAIQVCLVMGLAFFLWERKPLRDVQRPQLTPSQYARDFIAQPGLLRMGVVNFLRAYMGTAANGFLVLFGTVTLGASKSDYSRAIGWMPLLSLGFVWVAGLIADRLRRDRVLLAAFSGCVTGYLIAWQSHSLTSLAIGFVIFNLSFSAVDIGYKSLVTEFYPPDMVGQLAGAINIFYASGRTLALVTVGAVIGVFNNDYRVSWLVAIGFGLASIVAMRRVRDPRPPLGERAYS